MPCFEGRRVRLLIGLHRKIDSTGFSECVDDSNGDGQLSGPVGIRSQGGTERSIPGAEQDSTVVKRLSRMERCRGSICTANAPD
jgi:hypothetical protein